MFDPQGKVRMVPADQAGAATKAGGKPAVKMMAPDKSLRWVPRDQYEQAVAAGGRLAQQPQTTATIGPSSGPVPPQHHAPDGYGESKVEAFTEKAQNKLAAAAPAVAAGVGAMVGGVPGAAAGGFVGSLARGDKASSAAVEGVEQGALEFVGGKLIPKLLAAAKPAADRAMARILGVPAAKNTVAQIREIGNIVNRYVGGALTLDKLAAKVGAVKESFNKATDDLVQNATGSRLVPAHSIIAAAQRNAEAAALAFNRSAEPIKQLGHTLSQKLSANSTPQEVLAVRRLLLKEKDAASGQVLWPAGTKQFRTQLYHELNTGIKSALPADAATQFAKNNNIVSKLIAAETAVGKKLAKREVEQGQSFLAHAAKSPVAWAATAGGAEGYREHHSIGGTLAGAAIGAGAAKLATSTGTRSGIIAAQKAIAKAEPALSVISKASPAVARAIEAIRSRPQQQ
jgi:hypothetical protein